MKHYKLLKIQSQKSSYPSGTDIRLSPEHRLCAKYDPVSVATFPLSHEIAPADRIVDNCAEEHIM